MPRVIKQKAAIQQQKVMEKTTRNMTPALAERYTQLMALYADNVEQTIRFKYQLGSIFSDIANEPKVYGQNAEELLRDALAISNKRDIDRVKLFSRTYSEAEVEQINHWHEKFPNPKTRINWSHLEKLFVAYISDEERDWWFDQICLNGWSCAELYRQIKQKHDRADGHGSKVKKPSSKSELIQKLNQPLGKLRTFYHKVWNDTNNPAGAQLSNNLEDVTEDSITELNDFKSNIIDALDYLGLILSELESLKLEEVWTKQVKSYAIEKPSISESTLLSDATVDSLVSSMM